MSVLFGGLSSYAGFTCPIEYKEKEFRSVFLYDDSLTFHESALCICKKSDLPVSAPLLVCCDHVDGIPCSDGTKTPAELLSICSEYLMYHTRIEDGCARLSGALISGKGLNHIISVASQVLHNPIILADQSFKILACSDTDNFSDPFLQSIVQDGYYPESYIKKTVRRKSVISSSVEVTPPITSEAFSPMRYMTMDLMVKSKYVGFTTVVEETPFKEGDSMMFSYLCRILVTELRDTNPLAYGSMRDCDYILMELLEGKLNGHRLEARLSQSGLNFLEPKRVLVIRQRENDFIQPKYGYFIDEYQAKLRQCPCVLFMNSIVCLINNSFLETCMVGVEAIVNLLNYSNFVCGISGEVTDPRRLPGHYDNASMAITLGETMKYAGPFYDYGRYCFFHMLSLIGPGVNLAEFCDPKYTALLKYDEENNTCYSETLCTYLEYGHSSLRTADAMHVHRNTIIYRLKRLEEQFGFHLDNSDELFSIHMSLKILLYLRNSGSGE